MNDNEDVYEDPRTLDERLSEIAAAYAAVSGDAWMADTYYPDGIESGKPDVHTADYTRTICNCESHEIAQFIDIAHESVPFLLKLIAELRTENDTLRHVIRGIHATTDIINRTKPAA